MRVEQAHPEIALDLLDLAQQRRERRAARRIDRLARPGFRRPQIHPVVGRVLADQVDLLHAFRDERRISARTEAGGRLRCRPRICGMTQKLHG